MKIIAETSGDGECFCFKVDTKTYIQFFGQENYDQEVKLQKESCEEIEMEYIERTDWYIYPSDLFKNEENSKIVTIDVEEGKLYFQKDNGAVDIKSSKKVTITI